jgi:hypothetical protein
MEHFLSLSPADLQETLQDDAVVFLARSLYESLKNPQKFRQPTEYVWIGRTGTEQEPVYCIADGQHRFCLLIFLLRLHRDLRNVVRCLKGATFNEFFADDGAWIKGKTISSFMESLKLTLCRGGVDDPEGEKFTCLEGDAVIARIQAAALDDALSMARYKPPPEKRHGADKLTVLLLFLRSQSEDGKFPAAYTFGLVPSAFQPAILLEDEWLLILAHLFVFCKETRLLSSKEYMSWARALGFRLGRNLLPPALKEGQVKSTMVLQQIKSRRFAWAQFRDICNAEDLSMCHGQAFAEYTHYSCGVKTNKNLGYPVRFATDLREEWKVILSIFSNTLYPTVTVLVEDVSQKKFKFPAAVLDVWHSFIHKLVRKEFMPIMFASNKWFAFKKWVLQRPSDDDLVDLVPDYRPARVLMSHWKEQGEVQIFVPGGAPVVLEEALDVESGEAEDLELENYFSENLPFFGKSDGIGTGTKKKATSRRKRDSGTHTPVTSRPKREREEKGGKKSPEQASGSKESGSASKKGKPPPPVASLQKTPIDVMVHPPAYFGEVPAQGQIFKVQKSDLEKALPILLGLAHTHGFIEVSEGTQGPDRDALFLTRPK